MKTGHLPLSTQKKIAKIRLLLHVDLESTLKIISDFQEGRPESTDSVNQG